MSACTPAFTPSFTKSILLALPLCALAATPASAAEVRLAGTLLGSCTLSLSTAGTLAISTDATVLGSEEPTGIAASMTVLAIGSTPTVQFTAPTLDAPAGFSSGAVTQIRYTSLGGSNQAYTAAASTGSQVRLLDIFTVHGRVTSTEGFKSGTYTLRTTATCQQ